MNTIQKLQKLILAGIFLIASSAVFAADAPKLTTPVSGVSVIMKTNKALGTAVMCNGVPVPMKQIEIINNSKETIYPYIFIGKHDPVDQWLQACNNVNRVSHPTWQYPSDQVYRVYVGWDSVNKVVTGMKPHTLTTINVPFYSVIADNPAPDKVDNYINWWNGTRVSIIDDKKSLDDEMKRLGDKVINNADRAQLTCSDTPPSYPPLPSDYKYVCDSSTLSPTFSPTGNQAAFSPMMPEQLNEYTFGDIDPGTDPYLFDPTNVGYNISYVDHFYLPIAIQPINNKDRKDVVGYVGTVKDIPAARIIMSSFVTDQKWPLFKKGSYEYPANANKLPGTYNVINDEGVDIEPNTIREDLVKNWFACVASGTNPNADNCKKVDNLFQKNYAVFPAKCAAQYPGDNEPPISDRPEFYVKHIYGWVAFDDCIKGRLKTDKARGFDSNDLSQTKDGDFDGAEKAYQILQYTTTEMSPINHLYFNPYVQLIHGSKYMGMIGAYAYSIDDRVGFMHFPGDGVIISVGGADGLPNPVEYDKSKVIHVGLGSADALKVKWYSYQLENQKLPVMLKGFNAFSIANENLPAGNNFSFKVTVKDTLGSSYKFNITNRAPFTTKVANDYRSCTPGDPASDWCTNFSADYVGDGKLRVSTLGAGAPIDEKDIVVSFGLLPENENPIYWDKYGVCKYLPDTDFDTTPDKSNKRAASFIIHSDDVKFPCMIVAKAKNGSLYYYTIEKPAPFPHNMNKDDYISCGKNPTSWCKQMNPNRLPGTSPSASHVDSVAAVKPFNPAAITDAAWKGNQIDVNYTDASSGVGFLSYIYFVNGLPCDGVASTCTSILNKAGNVSLFNVPANADAKITILATFSGLASEMSNEYIVHPAGGITAPVIAGERENINPANIDVNYTTMPSGGTPPYSYSYTITAGGNPWNGTISGTPPKVVLENIGNVLVTVIAHVEDSAQPVHNKVDSNKVTVDVVNPITPPQISNPVRQGDPTKVVVDYKPASRGSDTFTYTYSIDNGSPLTPQISGSQMLLSGFPLTASKVVLIATDNVDGATAKSDVLDVPAAGGFKPPVITKAGWVMPGIIAMEYAAASGGSGSFTYSYYVDDYTQPWTNFRVSGSSVLLQGLSNTAHNIKVSANDGKAVEFSDPFHVNAR